MTYKHRKTEKVVTDVEFKMDHTTNITICKTARPQHEAHYTDHKGTRKLMSMATFLNQYEKVI